MASRVDQRKADDATRARMFALDDALQAEGKRRHFLYDWTVGTELARIDHGAEGLTATPSRHAGEVPATNSDWTWTPEPTADGLEDLL